MFSLDRVVIWLIIGLLGGSLAGCSSNGNARGLAFCAIWVWARLVLLSVACCFACSVCSPSSTKFSSH
jgi:hypothetical protein